MRHKYRLAVLDDLTLREVFHMHLSGLGTITIFTLLFLIMLGVLSLLIVYTPVRNILPGYNENLRQQFFEQSARIDSLQTSLTIQRQYADVIKHVMTGEIPSDSVQRLDSMEMIQRTQILEENYEATDLFVSQYEQKEHDRWMSFDSQATQGVRQIHRPVRGVVVRSAHPDHQEYSTAIRTSKNENVLSTMRGIIVVAERVMDNTFTIVVQQNQYMSVYRQVAKALKPVGTQVEAGETIGLMDGDHELLIELWNAGQFVNAEEVIVW